MTCQSCSSQILVGHNLHAHLFHRRTRQLPVSPPSAGHLMSTWQSSSLEMVQSPSRSGAATGVLRLSKMSMGYCWHKPFSRRGEMMFPSTLPHTPVTGREERLRPALYLGVVGHKCPFQRRWFRLHLAGTEQTAPAFSLLAGCAKPCPCAESGGTRQGAWHWKGLLPTG